MNGGASRPDVDERIRVLGEHAKQIRRTVVRMAAGKGEGYVGQGLDVADILAVLFLDEMRYDPVEHGPEVDRLIFSAGHYSIGLWAALAEAGHLAGFDLDTYGADGSTLIMSTHEGHPELIELTGGSLAHGLGVATGLAVGCRIKGWPARVFNFMTDGELQEGSTWESAMFAGSERLDRLVAVVDVNAPRPTATSCSNGAARRQVAGVRLVGAGVRRQRRHLTAGRLRIRA